MVTVTQLMTALAPWPVVKKIVEDTILWQRLMQTVAKVVKYFNWECCHALVSLVAHFSNTKSSFHNFCESFSKLAASLLQHSQHCNVEHFYDNISMFQMSVWESPMKKIAVAKHPLVRLSSCRKTSSIKIKHTILSFFLSFQVGHGDCDNDLDCVGSLKCGANNCNKYNVSVADPNSDCCEIGSICFFFKFRSQFKMSVSMCYCQEIGWDRNSW